MAEVLEIEGVEVKKRSPWGVWVLNLATLGIYGAVHWNKISIELRDYSAAVGRPFGNSPPFGALALFPGSLLILPPLITIAETSRRVRRLQWMTAPLGGAVSEVRTPTAVGLGVLLNVQMVYLQSALNDCWDRAAAAAAEAPVAVPLRPLPAPSACSGSGGAEAPVTSAVRGG